MAAPSRTISGCPETTSFIQEGGDETTSEAGEKTAIWGPKAAMTDQELSWVSVHRSPLPMDRPVVA
jgi:hypothetical protein